MHNDIIVRMKGYRGLIILIFNTFIMAEINKIKYICDAYACIASHDQNGALLK